MTLEEYLGTLAGKTVAVIGVGVSNTPLIRLLRGAGIAVTACDKKDREALGSLAEELEAMGCALRLGPDYLEDLQADVIFRTPGLHPKYLEAARRRGSRITSEMEVFFQVCPCPIIAVTGSDGKTTTTTIIAGLLRAAGRTVHLGGNIGHPLLNEAGNIRRAPAWMQKHNLEWLYRLIQDPKRLFRRYLNTNARYLWWTWKR